MKIAGRGHGYGGHAGIQEDRIQVQLAGVHLQLRAGAPILPHGRQMPLQADIQSLAGVQPSSITEVQIRQGRRQMCVGTTRALDEP